MLGSMMISRRNADYAMQKRSTATWSIAFTPLRPCSQQLGRGSRDACLEWVSDADRDISNPVNKSRIEAEWTRLENLNALEIRVRRVDQEVGFHLICGDAWHLQHGGPKLVYPAISDLRGSGSSAQSWRSTKTLSGTRVVATPRGGILRPAEWTSNSRAARLMFSAA